jgi:hypothetical protein
VHLPISPALFEFRGLRANASPALRWQYTPRPDLTHATIYRGAAPGELREFFPLCTTAGGC